MAKRSVILGGAINNDGQGSGMMMPNQQGQEAVVRRAHEDAGVLPADIDYVEAHGTGTGVGDPIEAQALGAVLKEGRPDDRPCLVGSVKTNIGHLDEASGVAGLIKAALCVQHGILVPSLVADRRVEDHSGDDRFRLSLARRGGSPGFCRRLPRWSRGGRLLFGWSRGPALQRRADPAAVRGKLRRALRERSGGARPVATVRAGRRSSASLGIRRVCLPRYDVPRRPTPTAL